MATYTIALVFLISFAYSHEDTCDKKKCLLLFRQGCGCELNGSPRVMDDWKQDDKAAELCGKYCEWVWHRAHNASHFRSRCQTMLRSAESVFVTQLRNDQDRDKSCRTRIHTAATLLMEWSRINFHDHTESRINDGPAKLLPYICIGFLILLIFPSVGMVWWMFCRQEPRMAEPEPLWTPSTLPRPSWKMPPPLESLGLEPIVESGTLGRSH